MYKSVAQECPIRVSYKSVSQECPTRVFHKGVPQECPTSDIKECATSILQECTTRVSPTRVSKIVWVFFCEYVFAFGFVGSMLFDQHASEHLGMISVLIQSAFGSSNSGSEL